MLGDPLLRIPRLLETIRLTRERQIRLRFSAITSGLFSAEIPQRLKDGGLDAICINLNAENDIQYEEVMKPKENHAFVKVCAFISAATEAGLDVTCAAVAAPSVNIANVQNVAAALGVRQFKVRPFFP
jgi:molybdenum cofactor biosynthesis enzyme MoaA